MISQPPVACGPEVLVVMAHRRCHIYRFLSLNKRADITRPTESRKLPSQHLGKGTPHIETFKRTGCWLYPRFAKALIASLPKRLRESGYLLVSTSKRLPHNHAAPYVTFVSLLESASVTQEWKISVPLYQITNRHHISRFIFTPIRRRSALHQRFPRIGVCFLITSD